MRLGSLSVFRKTNNKDLSLLAAWHNPRSTTWRWACYWYRRGITVTPHWHTYWRKMGHGPWGASFGFGTLFMFRANQREVSLSLLGQELSVVVQSSMWRKD